MLLTYLGADTGAGDRLYDVDNRITAAQDNVGAWSHYTYNADGQRVRRKINNQETWQIYGLDGELLAEYPANGPSAKPSTEYGYRNSQLLVTAEVAKNVALASSGATVTASSTLINPPYSYPVTAMINGDRKGLNAGFGGNWAGSSASLPQWVQVDFNGSKTISEINVFSLQDNYPSPLEPTETTTFSLYGLTAFQVQYWNGSAWVLVPGGSVTGNNKVWKKLSFAPLTTTKIRVVINATSDNWTRVVEVEAWTGSGGPAGASINWLVTDHLGTPRMVIEQTGSLANVKRHDYLPFGEELFANVGGRSAGNGYTGGDNVRQQFTAKERDTVTGLDYFEARYYASPQGRFTSPDPFNIIQMRQSARNDARTHSAFMQFIGDPRRWNRFAYAVNSPVVFTDKTGLDIMIIENGPTKGNPIGHTAIAVTGKGVFSMGNGETTTRYDHKDKRNNIVGGGVADYLNRESPRRDTTIFVVKTTPEQDAAIVNSMVDQAQSKRDISQDKESLLIDNCATRVNEALDAAGGDLILPIDSPIAVVPGSAGARAMLSGHPVKVISIPQGTNLSNLKDAEKQVIERFEPPDRPMKKPDK